MEFEGLKPHTEYIVDIITVSGDMESDSVMLKGKTSKENLFCFLKKILLFCIILNFHVTF